MVTRQIQLDDETDLHLRELAEDHAGDLGLAVTELVNMRSILEDLAAASEAAIGSPLISQIKRAEEQIAQRRVVPWAELKRRHGL